MTIADVIEMCAELFAGETEGEITLTKAEYHELLADRLLAEVRGEDDGAQWRRGFRLGLEAAQDAAAAPRPRKPRPRKPGRASATHLRVLPGGRA